MLTGKSRWAPYLITSIAWHNWDMSKHLGDSMPFWACLMCSLLTANIWFETSRNANKMLQRHWVRVSALSTLLPSSCCLITCMAQVPGFSLKLPQTEMILSFFPKSASNGLRLFNLFESVGCVSVDSGLRDELGKLHWCNSQADIDCTGFG